MDMERERCYVYKKGEEPRMVYVEQAADFYNEGWADSPAKFFDMKEHGMDPENEIEVQTVGEALEGVKEMANGALNLKRMTKIELQEYAEKHFDMNLDDGMLKAEMITVIEDMIEPKEDDVIKKLNEG